jgi:DNA-binding transcriptional MerR regulator
MSGQLIGTVARAAGVHPRTLRFYETVGLLPRAARTPAGYRTYSDDTVSRLTFIVRAKSLGLTLKEIRGILDLRDSGRLPCASVKQVLADHIAGVDAQIARLQAFRFDLAAIVAEWRRARPRRRGPGAHPRDATQGRDRQTVCPIIESLSRPMTLERRLNGNRVNRKSVNGGMRP